MHKMRSAAFPPRRPSALIRYLLPAFFIITLFYYLRPAEPDYAYAPPSRPAAAVANPAPPPNKPLGPDPIRDDKGQLRQQSPAGKNAETPSEHTVKQQHDVNQPVLPQQEPLAADSPGAQPAADMNKPSSGYNQKPKQATTKGNHPIDRLIDVAEKQFREAMSSESHTLAEAAAAYRKKRGRHPPPGFDQWYQFASERNAVMVESFWDQIYHDLEPFWALPASEIRRGAWDYEMTINVRGGVANAKSDWFWTQIWLSLIQTIQQYLPDMDIALNAMDEPRLVVPWEKMNEYINKASASRGMVPAKDAVNDFERLPPPGEGAERYVPIPDKNWEGTSK